MDSSLRFRSWYAVPFRKHDMLYYAVSCSVTLCSDMPCQLSCLIVSARCTIPDPECVLVAVLCGYNCTASHRLYPVKPFNSVRDILNRSLRGRIGTMVAWVEDQSILCHSEQTRAVLSVLGDSNTIPICSIPCHSVRFRARLAVGCARNRSIPYYISHSVPFRAVSVVG